MIAGMSMYVTLVIGRPPVRRPKAPRTMCRLRALTAASEEPACTW